MFRWFANNGIAANFLMIGILLVGLWSYFTRIPLEVQPSQDWGMISIDVEYRGGSPEDVERGVVIPVELALEELPGIENIESVARRGSADIRVYTVDSIDPKDLLEEVRQRVDQINIFPPETEPPKVTVPNTSKWFDVIKVAVSGDMEEEDLVRAARRVRDDLLSMPGISQSLIQGETRQEISIEANLPKLRDYELGFSDLADAVRRTSVDTPAGTIQTDEGSLIIRSKGQAYNKEDFENIVILNRNGSDVKLSEVADVKDGFEEIGKILRFNGKRAMLVEALRLNDENALEIAESVKEYVATQRERFPEGIDLYTWDDSSIELEGRLSTLVISMAQGGLLVMIVLGLFLRPRIALWVLVGIPVAFAGGLATLPWFNLTLNTMSIFGFIIVIGLVVDDAIVTAENIYTRMREGEAPLDAAVEGAKEVAVPVTFGALTTIVAFLPLLSFDGFYGNMTRQIPPVVAMVLIFSLIETKLILPAHLKHLKTGRTKLNAFSRFQKSIADGLETFVQKVYRPSLTFATKHRYSTISVFIALAAIAFGVVYSGRLGFVNMPSIDRNRIVASIDMPRETEVEETDKRVLRIAAAVDQLRKEFIDPGTGESLIEDVLTSTGGWSGRPGVDPEEGFVTISVVDPGMRTEAGPKNSEISKRWKELVGEIPDARRFTISGDNSRMTRRMNETESLEILMRGPTTPEKIELADEIIELIESYSGIQAAWSDTGRRGREIHLTLTPDGEELGLTQRELGRQVRSAFFGEQAQRVQRGRDDIRVMVRLPLEERQSLQTLDNLRIKTPKGGYAPLKTVATYSIEPALSRVMRNNGAQVATIRAEPVDESVNIIRIAKDLKPKIDEILNPYPEYSWVYDGYVREHEETIFRFWIGLGALIFALYVLLAIPFQSLVQPFIVLLAVPFGIIGALIGHVILGITPSMLSLFGILALAGVVVNDSLVMVDFANRRRKSGDQTMGAVIDAGTRRFRPILLTSLTTFVGLLPLMLDPSLQAQFIIPMAASLGFGILFATFITLYLIPSAYLAVEDVISGIKRAWNWYKRPFSKDQADSSATKIIKQN